MNNVVENICYLIWRHDCVVVPSWGAFIVRYQSAVYDEEKSQFIPPRREVTFNPSIDHNDGLLATSIARHNSIPFARATKIVEEEVEAMKQQLKAEGEITFDHVGRFIAQPESSAIFEPSLSLKRYGRMLLEPVNAEPLLVTARKESSAIEEHESGRPRFGLKLMRAAASVAAVAALCLLLVSPNLFNRNDNLASVSASGLFTKQSSQTSVIPTVQSDVPVLSIAVPREEAPRTVSAEQASQTDVASPAAPAVAPAAAVEAPANANRYGVRLNPADRYCLVVASMPSRKLAEKFISENGNPELLIYETDSKYRVYVASGPTSEETMACKTSTPIARDYPEAWVCRMK